MQLTLSSQQVDDLGSRWYQRALISHSFEFVSALNIVSNATGYFCACDVL